jgi:tRNA modification GTPase
VTDLIVAVASPPGRSARGVVRLSGPGAFDAIDCAAGGGAPLPRRRGAHLVRLALLGGPLPAVAIVAPAPRSYTGEDSAEILVPGSPALLDALVAELIGAARSRGIPARPAHAGEFTARAFLHGRLTIEEAEAVALRIAAASDAELRAADLLASGRVATAARRIAGEIAALLALVEAGIDFTDQEDVVPITPRALRDALVGCSAAIDVERDRAIPAERIEAVPWVVLAGAPNAGKSTLFNALLGRERAVVSHVAGTTRDALAEALEVETDAGPAEVMLVDVAGAGEEEPAEDALARAMAAQARSALVRAELVLLCVPVGAAAPPPTAPGTAPRIVVRTKADGPGGAAAGALEPDGATVIVSAQTGAGLGALRSAIARRLADRAVSVAADAVILTPRHLAALASAGERLREAMDLTGAALDRGDAHLREPELVAAALRGALDAMAIVAGDVTPDDVLGLVFARFCVGK